MISLHPWRYNAAHDLWQIPGANGSVRDMRRFEQAANPTLFLGYAFAEHQSTPLDPQAIILGDSIDDTVRSTTKSLIETALELAPGTIRATRVGAIIWELCTEQDDWTNQTRWGGLCPTNQGRVQLYLGRQYIRDEPFEFDGSPFANKILARYQGTYKAIRERLLTRDAESLHYRRYLTVMMRRFRTENYRQFIPQDLPDEEPLPLASTQGDTFEEASNTILSSHSKTGPNAVGGWLEHVNRGGGDITVIAADDNINETTGNPTAYSSDTDLDGDDHDCDMTCVNKGAGGTRLQAGVSTRSNGNATTHNAFEYRWFDNDDGDGRQIVKVTSNTGATVASDTTAPVNGDIFTGESNGSVHRMLKGGVEILTYTEDVFAGNLRCGVYGRDNGTTDVRSDNWEAADLVAGANLPFRREVMVY